MALTWSERLRQPTVYRVEAHGRSYLLHDNDDPLAGKAAAKVTWHARRGQPYEQPLLEHIYDQQFTGTAVDVGANVGNHALWFAVVCRLHVVAFEPLVDDQLRANVELNDLTERIEVAPYALADHIGTATHVGEGRLTIDGDAEIPVRPLDDFELADVAVIKVDVEGMEPAVLRGAERTLVQNRPVVFAEEWADHPRWHDGVAAVLEPLGYRMTHLFTGREAATPVGRWDPT